MVWTFEEKIEVTPALYGVLSAALLTSLPLSILPQQP